MSNQSYAAESEALNKLFNKMTQKKIEVAEKDRIKKEEKKDGSVEEEKKPLQAAPTTATPIHSEYLEKKKREEEIARQEEEARRERVRKQIEKEEAEKAQRDKELAEERKRMEDERKKQEEEKLRNLFGVSNRKTSKEEKQKNQEQEKPKKSEGNKKNNAFGVPAAQSVQTTAKETIESKESKPPVVNVHSTDSTKEAVDVAASVLGSLKTEPSVSDVPVTKAEDVTETVPIVKPPIMKPVKKEEAAESPKQVATPVVEEKPIEEESTHAHDAVSSTSSAVVVRNQSGMVVEKPKADKLSITGIVPMKSDKGSRYDSAMKASNAFRTNVFLTCVFNEERSEGAYGIVVDMGDKRVIHGMCGHTSDEWEYGFAGAIEAMRICTENNVKEIMFVVLDPLCEILQQNADGLRWGYSYTRSRFVKAISTLKQEAAIGFISEKVDSDYQDLAETIAKTLAFPVNE